MIPESWLSVSRRSRFMEEPPSQIERHKTAIRRKDFSLPVKRLLRDELIVPGQTFFDYGCGHGEDVELLGIQGVTARGWDPAFRPDEPRAPAEIVNLGYVLNVIEDPVERAEVLREAWRLCDRVLVVAARVNVDGRGYSKIAFGDGIVTGFGTFQKYYTQSELKEYLEIQLSEVAIPAALGVYYVFKDEALQQQFLAGRYRCRTTSPRKTYSEQKFEENQEVLEPFMARIAELGRLPGPEEYESYEAVCSTFGSAGRAFALIKRVTSIDNWEDIRQQRTEDLLVYLALSRLKKRPTLSGLPLELRQDIKEFFGSYGVACKRADILLFRAGDADEIDRACCSSAIGKLLPKALYVHRAALGSLEPLLRIYEGCARAYLGEIDEADIIKLHRFSGKVSYLAYPAFDRVAHPVLVRSIKVSLRSLQIECFDYSDITNPPVLHRKEAFLPEDYPDYQKFARLTRQEEKHGLLSDTSRIGTRTGWETRLQEAGFKLRGHRLVCSKQAKDK